MDDVAEKIESHAARTRMRAKVLAHEKKKKQDEKGDAAADRQDLKNAQAVARQFANGDRHHRKRQQCADHPKDDANELACDHGVIC